MGNRKSVHINTVDDAIKTESVHCDKNDLVGTAHGVGDVQISEEVVQLRE